MSQPTTRCGAFPSCLCCLETSGRRRGRQVVCRFATSGVLFGWAHPAKDDPVGVRGKLLCVARQQDGRSPLGVLAGWSIGIPSPGERGGRQSATDDIVPGCMACRASTRCLFRGWSPAWDRRGADPGVGVIWDCVCSHLVVVFGIISCALCLMSEELITGASGLRRLSSAASLPPFI